MRSGAPGDIGVCASRILRGEMMRFVCDHMLGTLAKWLRLLGFDTYYSPPIDDDELLKTAWREGRTLLTRDKNIGSFDDVKILCVKSDDLDEQLKEVIEAYDLSIKDPMSRCSLCNTLIREVKKEGCLGKVPEGVYEHQDKFWFCEKCVKYYWAGSHWNEITMKIEKIKQF